MNWIKSVRLENFQSHLDTYIEFDRGLNVIIGQSDSGKTAIFRGIRWALFNIPRGSDMIRVGADFARVTVEFSNGTMIVRERTVSKNRYIIKKQGEQDFVLEGFGVFVPQEILDAHEMTPLRIERDQELILHIAEQLDGPFLLDKSPAIRAKTIGRVSGAHYLDMAIRDTSKDVQKLKQQISFTEKEKENILEQLQPFAFLDEAKVKLQKAQNEFIKLKQLVAKRDQLLTLKQNYEVLKSEYTKWKNVYKIVENVDVWETKKLLIEQLFERSILYKRRLIELQQLEKNIDTCKIWLNKTKHTYEAEEKLKDATNHFHKTKKLKAIYSDLKRSNEMKQIIDRTLANTKFATRERIAFINSLERKLERATLLKTKKSQLDNVYHQVNELQKIIARLKQSDFAHQKTELIETTIVKYHQLIERKQALIQLTKQLEKGYQFLQEKTLEIANLTKQYEQKLVSLGKCPTCGSEIKTDYAHKFL